MKPCTGTWWGNWIPNVDMFRWGYALFRVDLLQVNFLAETGLDANINKSVGTFVAQTVERVIDRRLLSTMTWQGTNDKTAFQSYESVIEAIKGEIGSMWHLNVLNATLDNCMSCGSVSRCNEDELHAWRTGYWLHHHDEAQEEAWKHRLPTGEERRQTVCKPQNTGGKELNISWQATRNMKSRLVISWKCLLTGFLFELTIFFTLRFISYEMTCTFLNCDLWRIYFNCIFLLFLFTFLYVYVSM